MRQYTNDPLSCSCSHVDVACSAPPVRCLLASWIACLPVATRVLRIQAPLSAPPHHAPAAFDCTRVVRPPSRQVTAHLRPALKPPAHGGSKGMPLLPADAGHFPPHLKSAHKPACTSSSRASGLRLHSRCATAIKAGHSPSATCLEATRAWRVRECPSFQLMRDISLHTSRVRTGLRVSASRNTTKRARKTATTNEVF